MHFGDLVKGVGWKDDFLAKLTHRILGLFGVLFETVLPFFVACLSG